MLEEEMLRNAIVRVTLPRVVEELVYLLVVLKMPALAK